MALNKYLSAFATKRLNEVVIPGAHDAGIYDDNQIGGTGLTQRLDIAGQAATGVRWFDIRIAGELQTVMTPGGEEDIVVPKAFHKAMASKKINPTDKKTYLKGGAGGFGGRLDIMLADAKNFLLANPSEFLIFKISKSQDITSIYQECERIMGGQLYRDMGYDCNLNTKTVGSLAGTLITLFSESDADLIIKKFAVKKGGNFCSGVFKFKELYGKKGKILPYAESYRGLQYFGKFSQTNYYKTNLKKQTKNMNKGTFGVSPNAMGMMYWTLTSSPGNLASLPVNIEERNKKLWTTRHTQDLKVMWETGLRNSIENHMGNAYYNQQTSRHDWNGFIPNIVMLDFATDQKCRKIYNLNGIATQIIDEMVRGEWSGGTG